MIPEDVHELTGVADPRLSPDGRRVAFVVWRIDREANEYRSRIWVVPADGSAPPAPFTAGEKRDGSPRWSPDGTRLAFTSTRERDAAQLYVIPADGGEARRLTDLKEDVTQPAWSPDGVRIAFSSRVRDASGEIEDERRRPPRRLTRLQFKLDSVGWISDRRRHISIVPSDGSAGPEQITHGDSENGAPAWSPDGARIAFVSARHDDWDIDCFTDLYLVPSKGGTPERLTGTDGNCEAPSWSPDGRLLAYKFTPDRLDDSPHHTQIAVIEPAGKRERRLLSGSLDRNCGPYPEIREPLWESADRLLFPLDDHGNVHLYRVAANGGGGPERIIGGESCVTGFDSAGGVLVHAASTPTSLAELFRGSRPLTEVGRAFKEGRKLASPERFTAVSPDGTEVEAWIIRPAGCEAGHRYPVLLNIHGGPFTQYGNRFFDEFQVYAGAGYAVLYSNPRGSSGYSEEWGRAIRGSGGTGSGQGEGGPGWGSVDYDDLIAVTDEALKRFDFCDPARVGVMGGSYGGFMTSWMVGHTDRFKAACTERALNSFHSEWGSSDFGWTFKSVTGAFLFENPEAYLRLSPLTYAPNIKTPLLIVHSENDLRCAVEQAEALFTTLRVLKRDVELVRFPAESHELTRSGSPAHRVARFEIILDWLARRL
jgi:dipeptidyl aminopeptidase/acylaminoacyl peptidase